MTALQLLRPYPPWQYFLTKGGLAGFEDHGVLAQADDHDFPSLVEFGDV